MYKSKIKILLIYFFVMCGSFFAHAQEVDQSLSSLKGIKKLGVIVEKFNTDLESKGVSEDGIRRETWTLLKKAGIKVIPVSETHSVHGSPYLYINVGAIKSKQEDLYAVSIHVELRQNVILSRDTTMEYYGIPTWSNSNIGIISTDKLKQISNFVMNAVKIFINDYKTIND